MSVHDAVSPKGTAATDPAAVAPLLAVRPGEQAWTAQEVEAITEELTAEVVRLTAEVDVADAGLTDLLRNSGDGAGDDQADSGASALEREHELTLLNNTRGMLAQNTRALERIADASYGTCESCGAPIGKARLQAFPRATLCVACKQREERR